MTLIKVDKDRFESRIQKTESCWIWRGYIGKKWGYGIVHGYKNGFYGPLMAHRIAWYFKHGEWPDGFVIMHSCDVPACVNPAHLSKGSHADNVADKVNKGRHSRLDSSGRSKLCSKDIPSIKKMLSDGDRQVDIARIFGVSPRAIRAIKTGKTWNIPLHTT